MKGWKCIIILYIFLLQHNQPVPAPVKSLGINGRYVTVNNKTVFLTGQMDYHFTTGHSISEVSEILDSMMVPYYMNLLVTDLGTINWGGWNNLVNVKSGKEKTIQTYDYPWKRSGYGETTFGGSRFDLEQFDPDYFERLINILRLSNERGIVPVVGIFSEHGIDHALHWKGHPFYPENNINCLGLPYDKAIPEYFENSKALEYQEKYVRKLLAELSEVNYILSPFGEVNHAPDKYIRHWLQVIGEYKTSGKNNFLVCFSGSSEILDKYASDPVIDLIDIYCYHQGRYDEPEYNVPGGPLGILSTLEEARTKYQKPVGKLYFKYGYPYNDPGSPWANSLTGTEGGGPASAAMDALNAVYKGGGFGIFFKMAWGRDRGQFMKPDSWSEDIKKFMHEVHKQRHTAVRPARM